MSKTTQAYLKTKAQNKLHNKNIQMDQITAHVEIPESSITKKPKVEH